MVEDTQAGDSSIVLHVYCVSSTALGACYASFLIFTLTHKVDYYYFFFILQDEKVEPQRRCDLPRGHTGKFRFDSTFV